MEICDNQAFLIAPCLRGFGFSSNENEITSLKEFAEDINAFMSIEFAQYKDYYVVGHGMGAMVAVHLSLIDPVKVRGLILLSPLRPDGYKSDIKINCKEDLFKYEQKNVLSTMINKKSRQLYNE